MSTKSNRVVQILFDLQLSTLFSQGKASCCADGVRSYAQMGAQLRAVTHRWERSYAQMGAQLRADGRAVTHRWRTVPG